MQELNNQLHQLPNFLHSEVVANAGNTAGLTPAQLIARYHWAAETVMAQKRASYIPSVPDHELAKAGALAKVDIENMAGRTTPPELANNPIWRDTHSLLMYSVIVSLRTFIDNMAPVQSRLEQEAHQQAVRAAQEAEGQLAQRQAEEAAHRLAQRQAAEAAQQLAQRQAEEAARQLAQRQTEEAARLAAETAAQKLAQEQAEAAVRALAQTKAQESALQEARIVLELTASANTRLSIEPVDTESVSKTTETKATPVPEIRFMPGPAATAEIEQATLTLKRDIDAAVTQFASAIGPYLQSSTPVSTGMAN